MVKYKIDVLKELKKKGYTTYKIRKYNLISERMLGNLRNNKEVTTNTLNAICIMLHKPIQDIITIEITDQEKTKFFK